MCRSSGGLGSRAFEQAQPLADVEGGGVHFGLKIAERETPASGVSSVMEADQVGNDAFDASTLFEVLLEFGGLGIGAGIVQSRTVVTDEDATELVGGQFVAPAGLSQRTVVALVGGKAEETPIAGVGAIGKGTDLTVGAGERVTVGGQGKVVWAKALAALAVIDQGGYQLSAPVADRRDRRMTLACARSHVVDELGGRQVMVFFLGAEQSGDGCGIVLAACVGLNFVDEGSRWRPR